MTDATQMGSSWTDTLLHGVNALIDSQAQRQFLANEAKYNTAGGTAGQSQLTPSSLASSPVVLLIGVGVLALVLVLALKR